MERDWDNRDQVLEDLRAAWDAHPDLTLGELISLAALRALEPDERRDYASYSPAWALWHGGMAIGLRSLVRSPDARGSLTREARNPNPSGFGPDEEP